MSDNKQLELDLDYDHAQYINIDVSNINDTGSEFIFNTQSTVTIDTDLLDTGDYNSGTFTINTSFEEWVDTMPSMSKIKGMCEQYPAFQKEFEKFKQIYNLIKDDYEANNEDELPF